MGENFDIRKYEIHVIGLVREWLFEVQNLAAEWLFEAKICDFSGQSLAGVSRGLFHSTDGGRLTELECGAMLIHLRSENELETVTPTVPTAVEGPNVIESSLLGETHNWKDSALSILKLTLKALKLFVSSATNDSRRIFGGSGRLYGASCSRTFRQLADYAPKQISGAREDFIDLQKKLQALHSLLGNAGLSASNFHARRRLDAMNSSLSSFSEMVKTKLERNLLERTIESADDQDMIRKIVRDIDLMINGFILDAIIITEDNTWKTLDITATRLEEAATIQYKLKRVDGAPHPLQHDECQLGTRVQILEEIENWVYQQPESRFFWLSGHAGYRSELRDAGLLGGSFFCTRTDSARQDGRRILPELAAQLAEHSRAYRTALAAALNNAPSASSDSISEQFRHLFALPLTRICLPVVLLIDGLDEFRNDEQEFELMTALLASQPSLHLKFIVCSRPEANIRQAVAQSPYPVQSFSLSHIQKSISDGDIRIYLDRSLKSRFLDYLPEGIQWPPRELDMLVEKASGLFAYASSVVRYLRAKQADPWERMQRLVSAKTPPGKIVAPLDELYMLIMQEAFDDFDVDAGEDQQLLKCLRFVSVLRFPLPLVTLAALVDIPLRTLRTVFTCLHSVLHVPKENRKLVIVPYHISFFEYLTDQTRAKSQWFIDRHVGHEEITRRCVAIMNSDALPAQIDNRQAVRHLSYALGYCMDHLEKSRKPLLSRDFMAVFRCKILWFLELQSIATAHLLFRYCNSLLSILRKPECVDGAQRDIVFLSFFRSHLRFDKPTARYYQSPRIPTSSIPILTDDIQLPAEWRRYMLYKFPSPRQGFTRYVGSWNHLRIFDFDKDGGPSLSSPTLDQFSTQRMLLCLKSHVLDPRFLTWLARPEVPVDSRDRLSRRKTISPRILLCHAIIAIVEWSRMGHGPQEQEDERRLLADSNGRYHSATYSDLARKI
ncbi:hypothetical protein C8J57DRAFT_1480264 [Mycena rebaudengoi]|nr:hypothetical protein C8J57DRAFT_1480264 [Mycena rebaudengoi]